MGGQQTSGQGLLQLAEGARAVVVVGCVLGRVLVRRHHLKRIAATPSVLYLMAGLMSLGGGIVQLDPTLTFFMNDMTLVGSILAAVISPRWAD